MLVKTQGTNEYANIYCALKDKDGDLWFGTMGEGVYRYDGKTFSQFTDTNGLCNNFVYAMIQDSSGNIWFGTAYGVCRYNGKKFEKIPIVVVNKEKGSSYTLPSGKFEINLYGNPSMENIVWSIFQDKKGTFWFGTFNGVYCFDGVSFNRFLDNKNIENKKNVQLKMVDCILEDRSGDIWFCSGMIPGNEGICRYDGKAIDNFKPSNEGWIRKVIEDKNGTLYFATRHNGVWKYDGKNFDVFTTGSGIDDWSVTTIFQDKAGNIWVGTEMGAGTLGEDGGVWKYDGNSFTKFTTKNGLIHNGVFCILEDKAGNIWLGTRNTGLSRFDGITFTNFSE